MSAVFASSTEAESGGLVSRASSAEGRERRRFATTLGASRRLLSHAWARIAIVATATIAAVGLRRPDQFLHPSLWAESGAQILPQYLQDGFLALFEPVNGYLILPAKVAEILAWKLSAPHFPEIALALTLVTQIVVLCCIALSPTTLRHPLLCALFTLAVPTDPEAFGVSLYLLWWGTLLLVPVLFWDESRSRRVWPRLLMVGFGALSSPTVVAVLPLFLWRWLRRRSIRETTVLVVTVLCAGVQALLVLTHDAGAALADAEPRDLLQVLQKFFGLPFLAGWSSSPEGLWTGVGIFVLLVLGIGTAVVVRSRESGSTTVVMLLYLVVAAIVLSISRQPIEGIHPVLAGPRYFFYPSIFLGWLLLQLTVTRWVILRWISSVLVVVAAFQAVLIGPRHNDSLPWAQPLLACAADPDLVSLDLPVQFDGVADRAWHVTLTTDQCRSLVNGGLIRHLHRS